MINMSKIKPLKNIFICSSCNKIIKGKLCQYYSLLYISSRQHIKGICVAVQWDNIYECIECWKKKNGQ